MIDAAALFAAREFSIRIELEVDDEPVDALITSLFDEDSQMTWRPDNAVVAVGEYLTGPYAGEPVIISDLDVSELKRHVH